MKEQTMYRMLLISALIVLLVVGIYFGLQMSNNNSMVGNEIANSDNDIEDNKQASNKNVEIYSDPNDAITDIEVIYETYYKLSDKTESESNMVYGISLNELKTQESKKNETLEIKYNLVEESNTKLLYKRQLEQYAPDYFEVKLEDNKIVISNILTDEIKTVFKEHEIEQNRLRPELLEALKNGIKINSKTELNALLEDIET